MLTLADPTVRTYLAHHAADPADRGATAGFVDWLQDQGAAPVDLAVLFAGTPPEHADGPLLVEVLAWWLECSGQDARLIRGARVSAYSFDADGHPLFLAWLPGDSPADMPLRTTVAAARRDLQRRVLALPWARGVRVERHASISRREMYGAAGQALLLDAFRHGGFRPNLRLSYSVCGRAASLYCCDGPHILCDKSDPRALHLRQTLSAPQLIWPELEPPPPRYSYAPIEPWPSSEIVDRANNEIVKALAEQHFPSQQVRVALNLPREKAS